MEWYLKVIKEHYADFNGRARRKEYWMFVLFNFIISAVLQIVFGKLLGLNFIASLYGLAVLVPGIAVGVRRLHDIGKSGWWLLLALIPIVNFYLIYLLCVDSQPEANQWGANPKA